MAEEARQRRRSNGVVPEPEPAHTRRSDAESDSDNDREATELQDVTSPPEQRRLSRILSPPARPESHWYNGGRKFWRHNVRITVPHDDCRDHLANERTFLGYLRTSLALAMLGVIVAQLYRLQHSPSPDPTFGYFVLATPLSCILHVSAACVTLLGCVRFFRQQHAMAIGKIRAGGLEIMIIGVYVLLLLLALFAVHVGINIHKEG